MKTTEDWALDTDAELSPTELKAVSAVVEAVRDELREALALEFEALALAFNRGGNIDTAGRAMAMTYLAAAHIARHFDKTIPRPQMVSFPVIPIDPEADAVVDKLLAQKRTTAFTKIKTGCSHPRSEEGMNPLGQFFCGTCGEVFK